MKRSIALVFLLVAACLFGAERTLADNGWSLSVQADSPEHTTLTLRVTDWSTQPVQIDGQTWYKVFMGDAQHTFDRGAPELPKLSRSLLVPGAALMDVRVTDAHYTDYPLPVAPSKGIFSREVDPDTVPYLFGPLYGGADPYPAQNAGLDEPYIMHNARGIVVSLYPFQYLPARGVLRVFDRLTVEVFANGEDTRNVLAEPLNSVNQTWNDVYNRQFVNYPLTRYNLVPEQGRMIVICNDDWTDEIAPWAAWKNRKGISTMVYPVSAVGSTYTAIKSFIQTQYNLNNGLTFVQLVGDAAQVPPYIYGSYTCDPCYSLLAGGDSYPDIFVGRFSAESLADVETQVQRSIYYERDLADGDWLARGTGIASSQGAGTGDDGEADYVHIGNIRPDLLAYTYTSVDELYATNGATAAGVANALNDGRSFVNYCGHGSDTAWSTTGFSNTHVNNLANDYMLPFIISVACYNGNFNGRTCFAEAWLRASGTTLGTPTGAIGFYGSSISQAWAPPMCAQDEIVDLLCAQTLSSFGALCYNGSCQMMDEYGSSGASTFRTWQVFGDASLQVRTAAPQAMTVTYPQSITPGTTQIVVSTGVPNALVGISRNSMYVTSAYTSLSGIVTITLPAPATSGQSYDLVVTGSNRITYQGGFVVGGADPVRDITISISDGLACLRWSAYPGAIRYNIYGAAERGDEFSLVCTGPDTHATIPITTDTYFFQVTAVLSE